jgi:pimeloyl-ACP methyl ester carboxylesterase
MGAATATDPRRIEEAPIMARTPLLLLPGLLCDERLFGPQVAGLADVAETTVADLTGDASIEAVAERVLAAAPETFALVGLSMGGYVALEIVARAPERVRRLALLDSRARADTEAEAGRRRELIELTQAGRFAEVPPRLLPLFLHPDRLSDERLTRLVLAMAESVGPEAFVRQQTALLARADRRTALGAITCPTLVLAGRQDALTPIEVQEEMAAAIPSADLVILANCGHLSTVERPEAVNAHLRVWLEA